jgi:glycosyltransferase involved in cell wall biosynthesis
VHVVSENIQRTLVEFGVHAGKIHRFPFGIDTERFRPCDSREVEGPRRIVCVRKHEPIYDNATILQALSRLRSDGVDFRCTFVGGGSLLDQHRRLAAELALDGVVEIVGNVPYDELPGLLRAADVYVSAAHSDGTSSSLLEAMASGLLPVVTDIDGNSPWIRHGETGFLFPPGNAVALGDFLRRGLQEVERVQHAIAANRELVILEGDRRKNDQRMAELLEAVAQRGRPAGDSQ